MKASKKNKARLKRRVEAWELIKPTSMFDHNVKVVNGDAYRKPGSQKK